MAEPTLLPERLQYRPTKIELDESIEKAKATLLKKIKRSVYVYRVEVAASAAYCIICEAASPYSVSIPPVNCS